MYWEQGFNLCASSPAHRNLAGFLLENASALVSASGLLGGRGAVRRTAEAIEGVSTSAVLTRRLREHVRELYRLLSLQNVDVADSVEAAHFAQIDPSSPVIQEICLLTDELAEHLEAIACAESNDAASRAA